MINKLTFIIILILSGCAISEDGIISNDILSKKNKQDIIVTFYIVGCNSDCINDNQIYFKKLRENKRQVQILQDSKSPPVGTVIKSFTFISDSSGDIIRSYFRGYFLGEVTSDGAIITLIGRINEKEFSMGFEYKYGEKREFLKRIPHVFEEYGSKWFYFVELDVLKDEFNNLEELDDTGK